MENRRIFFLVILLTMCFADISVGEETAEGQTAKQIAEDVIDQHRKSSFSLEDFEEFSLLIIEEFTKEVNAYLAYIKQKGITVEKEKMQKFYEGIVSLYSSAELKGFESEEAARVLRGFYTACDAVLRVFDKIDNTKIRFFNKADTRKEGKGFYCGRYLIALESYLKKKKEVGEAQAREAFVKELGTAVGTAPFDMWDGPPGHPLEKKVWSKEITGYVPVSKISSSPKKG